jgi:hypothetical protein
MSGFFGSGKSVLLKVLGVVLEGGPLGRGRLILPTISISLACPTCPVTGKRYVGTPLSSNPICAHASR